MAEAFDTSDRRPAPPGFIETVRDLLPIGEMPPERYVALHGHEWLLAGPLEFSYPDPEVDEFVRRTYELLRDSENLDRLRHDWLSPEELERVQAEKEALAEGL